MSVTLDERAASTSAAKVLERHAAMAARDLIMPPVNPLPSRNSKMQAMQRLAIQKGKYYYVKLLNYFFILADESGSFRSLFVCLLTTHVPVFLSSGTSDTLHFIVLFLW